MMRCPHCGSRSLYADEDGRARCLLCTRPLEPLPPPEEPESGRLSRPYFRFQGRHQKPRATITGIAALSLAKGKAEYSQWPQRPRKGKQG